MRGERGSQLVQLCAGAQIKLGDLTPYLTYGVRRHAYLLQASGQMFKDDIDGFFSTQILTS